jgi:hypothetical protein
MEESFNNFLAVLVYPFAEAIFEVVVKLAIKSKCLNRFSHAF